MLGRSRVVARDIVIGGLVAAILTALSPSLNTPAQGLATASLFGTHLFGRHCE
jgi:hypothetical protein